MSDLEKALDELFFRLSMQGARERKRIAEHPSSPEYDSGYMAGFTAAADFVKAEADKLTFSE